MKYRIRQVISGYTESIDVENVARREQLPLSRVVYGLSKNMFGNFITGYEKLATIPQSDLKDPSNEYYELNQEKEFIERETGLVLFGNDDNEALCKLDFEVVSKVKTYVELDTVNPMHLLLIRSLTASGKIAPDIESLTEIKYKETNLYLEEVVKNKKKLIELNRIKNQISAAIEKISQKKGTLMAVCKKIGVPFLLIDDSDTLYGRLIEHKESIKNIEDANSLNTIINLDINLLKVDLYIYIGFDKGIIKKADDGTYCIDSYRITKDRTKLSESLRGEKHLDAFSYLEKHVVEFMKDER